ncbi:MAG: hypothetical protein Q4B92_03010 [Ruminococcus sp.]|nr:hypothetical protein [Ruminococcus sp.]MDO4419311.1 hypothetical protein [Ruminococcus sp.]
MEGFCEQVVKVKKGTKHVVLCLLIVLAFLLPIVFLMMLFYTAASLGNYDYFYPLFALVLAMFGAFVLWATVPRILKVDYDYSVYGSDFIVAKVTAKASRKRKLKVEIKNIEKLAKVTDEDIPNQRYAKKFDFTGGHDVNEVYFAEFRLAEKGLCLLLFVPNEKILEGMRPYLKREIALKLFYGRK